MQTYNYKELCELMGEENKKSKQRTDQFERWRLSYDIQKLENKNRYTIRELTTKEKREIVTKFSYQQYIEPMLYKLLLKEKTQSINYSMLELMYKLYLVNGNYVTAKCKANQSILSDYFNWSETSLNSYTFETYKMFKRIIRDIFKSMKSRDIIRIKDNYIKVIKFTDSNGIERIKYEKFNEDETRELMKYRRIFTTKYGCDTYDTLSYFKKQKVDELVAKKMNISYYYTNYHIILNDVGAKDIIKNNNYEFKDLGNMINDKVQTKVNKSLQGDLKNIVRMEKLSMTDTLINKETDGYLCKNIIKENI